MVGCSRLLLLYLCKQVTKFPLSLCQFSPKVREAWQTYELDLINYQNKCKVIRGLEDLFNKVREHINSVSAMKLSPYYKVPWIAAPCRRI